jgi:subfamily B ATP-binding cassette protein MsbA
MSLLKQDEFLHTGWTVYRRLLTFVKDYWPAFIIAIVANMVYSGVDAWFVHFLKPLLDQGFIHRDAFFISMIPIIILGIFLVRGVAGICSTYFMAYVARHVVMVLRQKMFRHFQGLPAEYFDKSSGGKLLSSIVYNVEQVANASADALTTTVQAFFFIVGLIVVMFLISWKLSLVYFFAIPLIVLVVRYTSKRVRRLSRLIQESMGDITTVSEEAIDGYKVVRAFGGQKYETDRFNLATKRNRQREMKVVVAKGLSVSCVQFLAAAALAVIVTLATHKTLNMQLSAGEFASMIAAMLAILKPMKDLTNVNSKIQRGIAGAQSVFSLLDQTQENDVGTLEVARVKGDLELKNVDFSYQTEDKSILSRVSFHVTPGKMFALVGRSGSGKSTLINLLLRFYEVNQGSIILDGQDIRDYTLQSLRKQFAYVSQEVILFNDTIANNIAYGAMRECSPDAIRKAAIAAHAMPFIDEFSEGLNTMIGDNGVLLSGGQRQRIAIARAILKNAPILLLDEATSALDTESERHIQAALESVMEGRTTLVVAHRLSTIKKADQIIVMDEGKIVEQGQHEALLAKNAAYANFYHLQFDQHE